MPFARFAVGSIELQRKHFQRAYELFRDEGKAPEAFEARYMAIQALIAAKDFSTLAEIKKAPEYARLFSSRAALHEAVDQRNWSAILRLVPLAQLESYTVATVLVTLSAGLAWAFFLAHLGELPRLFSATSALWLLGFLLGAVSTVVTVYLVILQDDIWHFSPGEDLYRSLAYHLVGVGTREELSKLVFFAPLIPFLIKRDDEFEALIAACFVGLGFAIEENASYFLMSSGASAPGRFLTANFFHIALTGLNGLALYRACTRGWAGVNELLFVLPITIMVHGAYDALLGARELDGSGYLATIVYILFSMYFFRRVHEWRSNVRMTISLTGAFVIGISFLAAVMIAFQMAQLGASAGMAAMFGELLSSGILLFMFFREFNEPLTR
jgi:RsiW-degrading membrane proteinase PrsW (M82 family)